MSEKPVYLETWRWHVVPNVACQIVGPDHVWNVSVEHAAIAAAAPALVRALLGVEWDGGDSCGMSVAPCCGADKYPTHGLDSDRHHGPGCDLDAALTSAGFPDQASREAAREAIRKAR